MLSSTEKYSSQAMKILSQKFPNIFSNVVQLEKILGYQFTNKTLGAVALTHRSALVYWNTEEAPIASNEVLEFYGDSVLSFVVSTVLIESSLELKEGDLSKMRAAVVGTENLALKCEELKLHNLIVTGKGEQLSASGARKKNMLADCFEAVLGAYVLDAGLEKAQLWLRNVLAPDIISSAENARKSDPKSALQDYVQKICNIQPNYKLLGSESTHTETLFIVGAFLNGHELARAKALNKRDASKLAAAEVMQRIESHSILESDLRKLVSEKI